MLSAKRPNSSRVVTGTRTVRSPVTNVLVASSMSFSTRTMPREISHATTAPAMMLSSEMPMSSTLLRRRKAAIFAVWAAASACSSAISLAINPENSP